jgi:hypothetical protein
MTRRSEALAVLTIGACSLPAARCSPDWARLWRLGQARLARKWIGDSRRNRAGRHAHARGLDLFWYLFCRREIAFCHQRRPSTLLAHRRRRESMRGAPVRPRTLRIFMGRAPGYAAPVRCGVES